MHAVMHHPARLTSLPTLQVSSDLRADATVSVITAKDVQHRHVYTMPWPAVAAGSTFASAVVIEVNNRDTLHHHHAIWDVASEGNAPPPPPPRPP